MRAGISGNWLESSGSAKFAAPVRGV